LAGGVILQLPIQGFFPSVRMTSCTRFIFLKVNHPALFDRPEIHFRTDTVNQVEVFDQLPNALPLFKFSGLCKIHTLSKPRNPLAA
jgi:hypothetical protein